MKRASVLLVAVLIAGCGAVGGAAAPTGISATASEGSFRLELTLPGRVWRAGEPITGIATLSLVDAPPTMLYGSGSGLIGFSYLDTGGAHRVDPVWTAVCAGFPISGAAPIVARLSKSGAVSDTQPDAAFLHSFLTAPDVRLPAGTWEVSAIAELDGCSSNEHTIRATVRISVGG